MKHFFLVLFIFFLQYSIIIAQVPTITNFLPQSGPIATSVTITGIGFDATPVNNVVFFGATQAAVTAATTTSLTVNVSLGATYQYISVTNLITGLTAYSSKPFNVTLSGSMIFLPKVDFVTELYPCLVSIGDLDGDGKPDLSVVDSSFISFSVLRNTSSSGTVSFAAKVDFINARESATSVKIGDVDGDGKLDVAVANSTSNTISVLRNTSSSGTVSFATKVDYTTGTNPQSVSIGDIDGDGKPDIAVANYYSNTVSLLRNTSSSGIVSFATKVDFATGAGPQSVSIGDIDGDGKPDMEVANSNSNLVSVLRNTSSGGIVSFTTKVDFVTGASPQSVSIGDIDGDGKPDMAVANSTSNTVSILRNTSSSGTVGFATKVDYTTGTNPQSVSIGDIDGDGKPDIAVANSNSNMVSVLRNTSSGGIVNFATKVDYTTGTNPQSVSIGDIDGDGKPDLAVTNFNSNTVSVLRQVGGLPVIDSFSPVNSVKDSVVTIAGHNFYFTSVVAFGGVNASSFTVLSDSVIRAVVSTGGSGAVSITTPIGSNSLSGFLYTGILSYSPLYASFGDTVTILGTNLLEVNTVSFGGVNALSFVIVNDSTIRAVVGYGNSGLISVRIATGTATISGFVYAPPSITSFSPTSATNRDTVIIRGINFTLATAVKFGNTPAYSFIVVNDSTIKAVVSAGLSGYVSVTTIGGTSSLASFTYVQSAPSIQLFSPALACSTNTTVTVSGLNFTGMNALKVGGVSTSYTFVSDTVIRFVTTLNTSSGLIEIINSVGSGTSSTIFIKDSIPSSFQTVPSSFQLCGGNPRQLQTNLSGVINYSCSNGQTGNVITITNPGSYILTATDEYGCSVSSSFTATNYTSCGGYFEIQSDSVVNYFDTVHVKVRIKNGVNIFSAFAYLNFDITRLRLISSQEGDYLGTNVFSQPPVVTGGRIDFGITKISGDPGSNGDGTLYEFTFVLADQLNSTVPFNSVTPNYFTTSFTLSNISVYNATGTQPPSFAAISMLSKLLTCRYYIPVWPGDLNGDRKVTVSDILPIGYFYNSTGQVRPNASLQWIAQPAPLWGFDKANRSSSAYKTFVDGTADGVINLADQTSIGFNLGRLHARQMANNLEAVPPINLVTNAPSVNVNIPDTLIQQNALPVNEVVNISIGSPSLPLNNLYGIAFDLYFDPAYVNTAGITTNYAGSIFGTQSVDFTKIEDRSALSSGRLSIGITRFNTTAITATGGTALNITVPLLANAPAGWFKITAIPTDCNNQLGNPITVNGSADSLRINSSAPCDVNYWNGGVSIAWENPANWSCGTIPGANTEVYIESGKPRYPEVSSQVTCKKMYVSPTATIKVNTGYSLNIVGGN